MALGDYEVKKLWMLGKKFIRLHGSRIPIQLKLGLQGNYSLANLTSPDVKYRGNELKGGVLKFGPGGMAVSEDMLVFIENVLL